LALGSCWIGARLEVFWSALMWFPTSIYHS
jgi:hypothetical protein